MMDEDEEEYMSMVEEMKEEEGRIQGIGEGIVEGIEIDIEQERRKFERVLGMENELVMREMKEIEKKGDYVRIRKRDERKKRKN